MKKSLKIVLILFLFLSYIYVYNITIVPNSLVLFEGENINLKLISGLSLNSFKNEETTQTSSSISNEKGKTKNYKTGKMSLDLFGNVSLKTVNISVIPKTKVIPVGTTIGMKLYTNGVLVVGKSEITGKNKVKEKPFEESGIEEGDRIISINGNRINNTNELIEEVNKERW